MGWGWRGCFCVLSTGAPSHGLLLLVGFGAQRGSRKGDLKRRIQTGWISLLKDLLIKGFVLKY